MAQQYLHKAKRYIGLSLVVLCGPAFSTDSVSFDVPAGSYQTVIDGSLVPGTLVKCQFSVEWPVFDERWSPSVSINFESEEQIEDGGLRIRLMALGLEEEQGWRHRLTIYRASNDYKSDINVHTGVTDSVMQLNLIFTKSESVVFFVGDRAAEFSEIDIAPAALTKWNAVVVGVKGSGNCDTRQVKD